MEILDADNNSQDTTATSTTHKQGEDSDDIICSNTVETKLITHQNNQNQDDSVENKNTDSAEINNTTDTEANKTESISSVDSHNIDTSETKKQESSEISSIVVETESKNTVQELEDKSAQSSSAENIDSGITAEPSCSKTEDPQQQVEHINIPLKVEQCPAFTYHLKWFEWKGEQTPIITQNENGPCPLLAIANVLILARKINLPKMQQVISGKQLMEYIGDCILLEAPKQEGNEELLLNYEQNMQDAIDIMYKLQTGIDVNVKFTGVTEFEFTPECIVFDLLKIQLYHGWLVDPQDTATQTAVNNLSYNQLVEKMIASKDSNDDSLTEGLIIDEFLSSTATQLTYYGLCELNTAIQEEELCVFFRNNHFSTLYKCKDELFLLVTDQGFLTEPAVIWETLANIEGDGQFVNSNFKTITLESDNYTHQKSVSKEQTAVPTAKTTATTSPAKQHEGVTTDMSQEDRDYLIALSLTNEPSPQLARSNPASNTTEEMDRQLAMKLQEDEDRLGREQQAQQQGQQSQDPQQQQQQQHGQRQQQQQHGQQQQRRPKKSPDSCIVV